MVGRMQQGDPEGGVQVCEQTLLQPAGDVAVLSVRMGHDLGEDDEPCPGSEPLDDLLERSAALPAAGALGAHRKTEGATDQHRRLGYQQGEAGAMGKRLRRRMRTSQPRADGVRAGAPPRPCPVAAGATGCARLWHSTGRRAAP